MPHALAFQKKFRNQYQFFYKKIAIGQNIQLHSLALAKETTRQRLSKLGNVETVRDLHNS